MKSLLFIICLPICAFSQKIGDGVLNIYNSVGIITFKTPSLNIEAGTGTLMYKIFPDGGMKIFVITCKHVLPPSADSSYEINFDIHNDSSRTGVTTLTLQIFDSLKRYSPLVKFDPKGNDVAVIDITGIFLNFPLKNLQRKPIPYDLIATRDSLYLNNIHVGDEVLLAGYPNFYYNAKNKKPVMRSGIISTPPDDILYFDSVLINIYRKAGILLPQEFDGFLIDANASSGLSGSLVFIRPQFLRNFEGKIEKNITTSDPLILGILSNSYFSIDRRDNTRINLGGVISADAIKRTVDAFIK